MPWELYASLHMCVLQMQCRRGVALPLKQPDVVEPHHRVLYLLSVMQTFDR